MPPKVVFCTTCKGRVQHLCETLPKNLLDNAGYRNCIFVVLGYRESKYGYGPTAHYLSDKHSEDIQNGRVVAYHFNESGTFQMAHAKNMAHRCGMLEGADILVNLDADNFTRYGFAEWLSQKMRSDIFLWSRMVHHGGDTPRCGKPIRNHKCIFPKWHQGQCSNKPLVRGIQGRIAITPAAFLKSGGYDERYLEWGPDDKNLTNRLEALGYTGVEIDNRFLTGGIYHEDDVRFAEYPHVALQTQGETDGDWKDTPIANFGNFGCGTVYRNFSPDPIELKPLPTRIFGVGLHKTGTTSLCKALNILGYDCAHWKSPRWAHAIYQQMGIEGHSRTLEHHYSLCDLPIPMLYRELDRAYPGSKYILTIRNEADWLSSVERHFNPSINPYPEDLNRSWTKIIHRDLYRRLDFNRNTFLARYRCHNAQVQEYFKDRPGDLLVMGGYEWTELCGFLERPIPSTPYPMEYVTK